MSRQHQLFDLRMADGSRHFAEVPWQVPFKLKQRLVNRPGVTLTAFVDSVIETWIRFDYAGHAFSVHDPLNDFWLFVDDPNCPENLLCEVAKMLA